MTAAVRPTVGERLTRAARVVSDRWLDWASFLVPLAVSLGANTVWGLQSGSDVFLVAGLVTPLTLVLAVERWQKTPAYDDWRRVVQIVGMALVALVAASWSWVHTTQLLLDQAPATEPQSWARWLTVALCVTAPLAVDGLAVLSVLSLGHQPGQTEPTVETPAEAPAQQNPQWGGPDTVERPAVRAVPSPTARPAPARRTPARRDPGQRTKRQLEARAKELRVKRRERESRDELAARVAAAEQAAEAENTAHPANDLPIGVSA